MNVLAEVSWPQVYAALGVIAFVGTPLVIGLRVWLFADLAKRFPTRTDHARLHEAHEETVGRLAVVERRLETVPTEQEVDDLSNRLRAVEQGVAVINATMSAVSTGLAGLQRAIERVENYLLNNKGAAQ